MNGNQVIEEKEISYAEAYQEQRKVSLFLPGQDRPSRPLSLLFIHGGGFIGGNKEQWKEVAEYFASLGYPAASVSYRLAPAYGYPAQVEDVRLAMQWMKRWNEQAGRESGKIVAIGSSAGAYLAEMLAVIRPEDELGRSPELTDHDTVPLAVVGYSPVTTLLLQEPFVEQYMGMPFNEHSYMEASPISRIRGNEPPFLLLSGDEDTTTPLADTQRFHDKIKSAGGRSELVVLPDAEHGFGYGVHKENQRLAVQAVQAFLEGLA